MRHPLAVVAVLTTAVVVASVAVGHPAYQNAQPASQRAALAKAIAAPTRTAANIARDKYRHPAATLAFFGVKPTDTVVELIPGGGWYTEILAPYLAAKGVYYAAGGMARGLDAVKAMQTKDAALYGKVKLAGFPATDADPKVPDGSADVVLTFRNIHNLRFAGVNRVQTAFAEMFRMLKPGGTLGIVEHRLPETRASAAEEKSGYMKVSSVVGFAKAAGFELVGQSEINANPRDTADYPDGVWTLPPNYRLKDVDRAKYAAIGESDRMTLKFRKPK
jgi:predicted methyltransferase